MKHGKRTDTDFKMLNQQPVVPIYEQGNLIDVLTHRDLFAADLCAQIIKDHSPEKWVTSVITHPDTEEVLRHCKSAAVDSHTEKGLEVYERVMQVVTAANDLNYHFTIDYVVEVQLTKYESGDFFRIHYDIGANEYGNRKLICVVNLSSSMDRVGGDLVVPVGDFTATREIGSVTIFPSYIASKVTPVTEGTMYQLVAWIAGINRFK